MTVQAAPVDRLPGAPAPAPARCAVGVRVGPALLWEADGPVGLALRLVGLGVDAIVVADPDGHGAALEPWEVATGARRPAVVRPLRVVRGPEDDADARGAAVVALEGDAAARDAARARLAGSGAALWDVVSPAELPAALARPDVAGVVLAPASLGELEALGEHLLAREGTPLRHAA